MGTRRVRATNLIELAEAALTAHDRGRVVASDELAPVGIYGLDHRLDREIRRVVAGGRWAAVTPLDVADLGSAQRGLLVLLASHPNGFVREAAVDTAGVARSSAGARLLAQRVLDPAPVVRDKARAALRVLFERELGRQPRGCLMTPVEVAARAVVARSVAVARCPELVDAALELLTSSPRLLFSVDGASHHLASAADRHRRRQLIRHLEHRQALAVDPVERDLRQRLIDWHGQPPI